MFLQLDIQGFPSPVPRCCYCSRRCIFSTSFSESANCVLASSGLPLGKTGTRFLHWTQGFHQPAKIKICISVSSHVQTAAGDDVSALDCCTASPVCQGGGWVRAARYQSSDLGGKVPPKVVLVLLSPQSPVHMAAFSKHAFVSTHTHTCLCFQT